MHDTSTATDATALYRRASTAIRAGDFTTGIEGMLRLAWAPSRPLRDRARLALAAFGCTVEDGTT